jgi:hypothetical protein
VTEGENCKRTVFGKKEETKEKKEIIRRYAKCLKVSVMTF